MFRKTLLGLAAATTLAAVAAAPTAASAKPWHHHGHGGGFGITIGVPGYGPYYGGGGYYGPAYYSGGYYAPSCHFKKVKVWSPKYHKHIWKTKKVCY